MIVENVKVKLEKLINDNRQNLNNIKSVALSQAWNILQLAIADIIQVIELNCPTLTGKDKKTMALDVLSSFYDGVFNIIDIPLVPNFLQPIIHKYVKSLLMLLVSASIDAMVTTFRNTGIFTISKT